MGLEKGEDSFIILIRTEYCINRVIVRLYLHVAMKRYWYYGSFPSRGRCGLFPGGWRLKMS